ncbi:N-acetylmannosamine-6-phosphate 2-epimerase [Anaerorhabdus sp.]|uniref:N-acetylmannosamine-6-phosphate 2-epimerase n=1 Tax=Anaerorhabdus sp. TaxID=1872524 RepID=UPI002FCBE025
MIDKIKGKLIVSCQALPDEPLHSSFIMSRMAVAAQEGGAVAIRAQSKEDILEIEKVCDLPVIGIVKRNYEDSEIYITPTQKEIDELLETNCEMIALDATKRVRPHGEKLIDLVNYIHEHQRLAMADCSTLEECIEAEKLGFDVVSTTLCGYTPYSKNIDGPNFELLKEVAKSVQVPLIAEGKINTPEELAACIELGAHAAVVGGAITRPKQITERFVNALK